MPPAPKILFTAFEPSGDTLAAGAIDGLRARCPGAEVWALAGPKSEQAGAVLVEQSTGRAEMLVGAARQARAHLDRLGRLERWLADHPIDALVAVDSPAANWSVCKLVRRAQPTARVVHLAAPQLWAWGAWRVGKLRRLTDLVMCLLPFEPEWFAARNIPATFVGHPLTDPTCVPEEESNSVPALANTPGPKLALLPGSRVGEVKANWPTMLETWSELTRTHSGLTSVVAAADASTADQILEISDSMLRSRPDADRPQVITGATERVIAWADVVLVVSGTATLQVALRGKPMVVIYNVGWWSWQLLGRWLVRTRTFALPNLIARHLGYERPVPEFVPHFHNPTPVVRELSRLLDDPAAREEQVQVARLVRSAIAGEPFGESFADQLIGVIEGPTRSPAG